jgi:hypothetical protein
MKYSVWLFTRPLSYARFFPPLAQTSAGKDHLRHWGILVSDMTLLDAQVLLARATPYGGNDSTDLGVMYELFRDINNKNNVNITSPFRVLSIRKDWGMFSCQYIGQTDMTHARIKREGKISFLSMTEKQR